MGSSACGMNGRLGPWWRKTIPNGSAVSSSAFRTAGNSGRERHVVLQHGHDVGPVLHHVEEHLPLTEPVGDGPHADGTAGPAVRGTVDQGFVFGREIMSVHGVAQLELQPEGLQVGYDPSTSLDRPFQTDDDYFQNGRPIRNCPCACGLRRRPRPASCLPCRPPRRRRVCRRGGTGWSAARARAATARCAGRPRACGLSPLRRPRGRRCPARP